MKRSPKRSAPAATRVAAPPVGIQRVQLAARRLVTILPDDLIWSGLNPAHGGDHDEGLRGAIVRLQPPADATAEDVERTDAWVKQQGAARVRVESRALGATSPQAAPLAHQATAGHRDTVLQLAGTSRRSEALIPLLERYMDEVKL